MKNIRFSFAEGGALLAQLRKLGILGHGQPSRSLRILLVVSITWIPLLILTAWRGVALGREVRIPFLFDFIQHARFLVALPIGIWAEEYISPKFGSVLNRFLDANIVSGEEIDRFEKAISRAKSLRDSVVAEVLLLTFSYLYIQLGLPRSLSPGLTSWDLPAIYAKQWYLWLSMPIFTFFWLRWVWRLCVWTYLLFQISRLKLRLTATHPDHAGGLAFVSVGQRRFSVLVLAFSVILSASIGEEIIFGGAKLQSFEAELVAFFFVCVVVIMGPLIVFTPPLVQAKLRDWGKYGVLAADYVQKFDDKWIQKKSLSHQQANEELLGTQDFQALADMQNSYEGIAQTRTLLPDRQTILILLVAYALPLLPLLATVIPLRQILSELLKLLTK